MGNGIFSFESKALMNWLSSFNSIYFKFHYIQCTTTTNYMTINDPIFKESLCNMGNSFGGVLLHVVIIRKTFIRK